MENKKIFFIIFFNLLFSYYKKDPIMISLSGAYNTIAKGYQVVGINPSNLAFNSGNSFNLFSININMDNNFLTRDRLQGIEGANLNYIPGKKYFSKDRIFSYLNGETIQFRTIGSFPFSGLNFSKDKFAITSELKFYSNIEFDQDILKLVLYGNEIDVNYSLGIKKNDIVIWESSFTKAFDVNPLAIGFTVKYLKGLMYYSLDPINDSYLSTNISGLNAEGQYLLRQNTKGNGFGLDLGISTIETSNGWKMGFSIINILSKIKWNKKGFLDSTLEDFYDNLRYKENEHYFIDLKINNLSLNTLNDVSTSDLFEVDGIKVYEVSNLPSGIEGVDYYCGNEVCDTYLVSSKEIQPDYKIVKMKSLELDYPTFMNIGASKKISETKYIVLDVKTGFDDSFSNAQRWRIAFGYIFGSERTPLRFGMSYGGYDKQSIGFGYGLRLGKFNFDFGLGYKGKVDFKKSNGIDFGIGLQWTSI